MRVTAAIRSDVTPDLTKVSIHFCCSLKTKHQTKDISTRREKKRERERLVKSRYLFLLAKDSARLSFSIFFFILSARRMHTSWDGACDTHRHQTHNENSCRGIRRKRRREVYMAESTLVATMSLGSKPAISHNL